MGLREWEGMTLVMEMGLGSEMGWERDEIVEGGGLARDMGHGELVWDGDG